MQKITKFWPKPCALVWILDNIQIEKERQKPYHSGRSVGKPIISAMGKKMGQPDEDPTAPDTRVVSLLMKLARVANGQLHSRIRIGNIRKNGVI